MGSSEAITRPPITLTTYQKDMVQDPARYRYDLICRQGGKDFGSSLRYVLGAHERKEDWVVLCAGEGQTLEYISQARVHAEAIRAAASLIEGREANPEKGGRDFLKYELRFPNGARIIALPANPMSGGSVTPSSGCTNCQKLVLPIEVRLIDLSGSATA